MITAYVRADDRLTAVPLEPGAPLPAGTIWLDVLRPAEVEREQISAQLGVDLPTREDMSEIEASSRLYLEGEAAFLTTPVISRGDSGHPDLGLLTFVLTRGCIITVRHTEPLWLAIFATRAMRHPGLVTGPMDVLLGLLEAVVDRAADVLELVGGRLDEISRQIFAAANRQRAEEAPVARSARRRAGARRARKRGSDALKSAITAIGWAGDLTQKVRDSLAGLERLGVFVVTVAGTRLDKDQKVRLKTITRDIHSLVEHAAFQAHQTGFLLDATLGVINIEQTNIIKIFSVAAVAFLPPTLVASIYGMNFAHMPELDQSWGYPLALVLMVLSAILPLLYFRRRGWL
ncbi:magnesium transporter CorA family protein [Rhodocista pekingensis]|uniref:Magnesium transporter CorA family protein n=1 Tax=Rhodocista pekingensis TaxID=201185 RepID=A0ABW2L0C4_9PROT